MFKISFQKMDMLPFIRFISFLCMSCVCPQYVQTTSSKISYRNVQVVQSCVRSNLKWITNLWRNTLQDHIIIGTSRILCVIVLWREMRKEKLTSQFHSIPLRSFLLEYHYTHRNFSLTSNVEYVEECLPNFLPNWDCKKTRTLYGINAYLSIR